MGEFGERGGGPCRGWGVESESAPVNTWFQDIDLVDAGTIVTVDLGSGRSATHRYWSLPEYTGDGALSGAEFVDCYRELLASSVDDCGMADVEIGLFLSGGIDSAAVAALARRKNPLRTFTALNGSTLANGDAEGGHRIARMLDLPNHQILYDTDQDTAEWQPSPARLAAAGCVLAFAAALWPVSVARPGDGWILSVLLIVEVALLLLPWGLPRDGRSGASFWAEALLGLTAPVGALVLVTAGGASWLSAGADWT